MRNMVWICDRCETSVAVPDETILVKDFDGTRAARSQPDEWIFGLNGWTEQYADEDTVIDVCPDCITTEEHIERVIREATAPVYFGGSEEPPA